MLPAAHQRFWTRHVTGTALLCALATLSGCGHCTFFGATCSLVSGESAGAEPPPPTYSLDATISGLTSSGLVLMVNATAVSVPAGTSTQELANSLSSGTQYSVTVRMQPVGETCSVADGSGTVQSANVGTVAVSCSDQLYTVGGAISGLTAGGLLLLNNGADALSLSANATQFTMNTAVAYGGAYAITVQAAPAGSVCRVSNGSGTMGAADVTSVTIGCVPNFTLLYSFAGGSSDGINPYHSLIQATDGNFYGTTLKGGTSGDGTIFELTPSGTETVLYSFAKSGPYAGLIQGRDGNFYGTTQNEGTGNAGTIFELTPGATESILNSFPAGNSFPYTGVIQGSDGNFYGTTSFNGSSDHGTVFEFTPGGTQTVLHVFPKVSSSDGAYPYAGLIQASDGNFYGTTYNGGTSGLGTVFEVTPSGTETILYSFAGGSDGANPYAAVIQGSDGNLYGTTYNGGASSFGTVFKLTPSGTETVLYSFAGGSDGASPEAGLTQGSDGYLYGATYLGGASGFGIVFKLTVSGTETVLHTFAGGSTDGANDWANLVQGADGNLYGTTYAGGTSGDGTFFKVTLQ